ncbi:penicillin-binding protein 2 [Geovibrio sp. ADMFC3]
MLLKVLKDEVLEYYKRRTYWAMALVIAVFAGLIMRLVYLQIHEYDKYKRLSENNRIRIVKVRADRGFIYDRKGRLLVKNTPSYELKVVKEDAGDIDELLKELARYVQIDRDYAMKSIKRSYFYEPAVIARGLTFEQVAEILENYNDFKGLEVDIESVREYMDSKALSHILGYLSEVTENDLKTDLSYSSGDMIGKTGIEKVYEEDLRGVDGARQVEVDSYGRPIKTLSEKHTITGNDLVLTLDMDLQKAVHNIFEGKKGAAVVLDVETFGVMALYSAPTYDLNIFSPFHTSEERVSVMTDQDKPLLNRAIEGAYPPGSVYKVLMGMAGLLERKITLDTVVNCTGEMRYGNFTYRCWKKTGHGPMKLIDAIAESCDVYFYQLGLNLGIDDIEKYSTTLGLGKTTGIDLPNEKSGFFPGRDWKKRRFNESWYPGETIITSIGQGYMTTTPLQVAVMLAGIFNGGKVMKPKVVEFVHNPVTDVKIHTPMETVSEIEIPKWIVDSVMDGMVKVIYGTSGTGYRARVHGITYGGKTGTAQVVSLSKTEHMEEDEIPEFMRDHAWFGAVVPEDKPKYAIAVLMQHGGSGSRSAAPVAGAIVNKLVDLGYVRTEQEGN